MKLRNALAAKRLGPLPDNLAKTNTQRVPGDCRPRNEGGNNGHFTVRRRGDELPHLG